MSMFSIFNVSGSAISAQSQRLNVVASNLANADAVAGPDGQGYKARSVVFQTTPMGADSAAGVKVSAIEESNAPFKRVHNPNHPSADAEGYVNGQHDLGLALVPEQHRSDEYRQVAAAENAADGPVNQGYRHDHPHRHPQHLGTDQQQHQQRVIV